MECPKCHFPAGVFGRKHLKKGKYTCQKQSTKPRTAREAFERDRKTSWI